MVRVLNQNSPDLDLGEHPPRRIEEDRLTSHPRLCGEHAGKADGPILRCGSSPPVRGTRTRKGCGVLASAVHPRLCGEHSMGSPPTMVSSGSSPPVRGTPMPRTVYFPPRRFIPACAGNTVIVWGCVIFATVHPRLCGEHATAATGVPSGYGSSPPVRGTRLEMSQRQIIVRFIPACAGNTSVSQAPALRNPVHPRLCGEHHLPSTFYRSPIGSSPPVRGTLRVLQIVNGDSRFIPACAGNTPPAARCPTAQPVHPRLCGEHVIAHLRHVDLDGSSPPVRGTLFRPPLRQGASRFIPACAGNTALATPPNQPLSVHPRLCGEHRVHSVVSYAVAGSSPPVRGTLERP